MSKRQIVKVVALSALAIALLIVLAGYFVLRSRAFHRYALAAMIHRAEKATGARVEIGDFTFRLSGLRVDFYRIALHGTESDPARPLCSIDHVGVRLKIISAIERQVALRSVEIDHPVVRVAVSADGRSNLPHPSAPQGKPFSLFSFAIGRLILRRGEIDLNDRQIPLEAKLRNVRAETKFNARKTEYDGSFGYRDGEIQFGRLQTLRHSLDVRFAADPGSMRVNPLVVTTAASQASIRATVENYSRPLVDGSFSIELATAEASRLLRTTAIPAGTISTEGAFHYQWTPARAFLDSLTLRGRLTSPRLAVRVERRADIGEARGVAAAVKGSYTLAAGVFKANDVEANLLSGRMRASATIRNLQARPEWKVTASLYSLSLSEVRRALRTLSLARLPIGGTLAGSVEASWEGDWTGLRIHSDATVQATLPSAAARNQTVGLEGALHLAYEARTGVLSLERTIFRTPASEIDLEGSVGPRSSLAMVAQTGDLGELDALLAEARRLTSPASTAAATLGLSGSAAFHGVLQGPAQDLQLEGQFVANDLAVRSVSFPYLETHVGLSASGIALSQGELRAAHGSARFQASLGLQKWTHDESSPIALQLVASGMSVEELERLGNLHFPLGGILAAHVGLRGSILHPTGGGTIEISNAEAWNQPIQKATLRFEGSGNALESSAVILTRAGSATARASYNPQSQAYNGEVRLGGVYLGRLHALEHVRVPISGVLTASIRGQGTLKEPHAQVSLSVPSLRIGRETITAVSAQATIANQTATLMLSSNFLGASARVQGTVRLTGEYEADLNFRTGLIDAGPLLASYLRGGAGELRCQTEAAGWLRGPLKDRQKIQAHAEVQTLRLAYGATQVSNVATLTADYQDGVLEVHPGELKGSGTDFFAQASVPVAANAALNASLRGVVDFHLLQIMYPDWATSGQVDVNVTAQGSRNHPDIQGRMQVVNAAIEPPDSPVGVQNLNATIELANGRAEIKEATAKSGGGSIAASGSVAYARGIVFALTVTAHNVRVRYPEAVRAVLDSTLRFSGTPHAALISGQASIDDLSLTPSFDLATFSDQFSVVSIPSGETAGFTGRVKLNVALRSSRELSLTSSELNLRGASNLRVQGTLANPVVVGRATLTGGELFFNGRRYQVENGVVDFVNPIVTQPVVNIGLVTTIDQYTLTLNFIGPLDRLRTTYASNPPLAPVDVVNLLISGKTTEAPGTGLGAQSILAQGIASQLSGRAQRLTGISSLTIDPQMGGNGTNPGARIAVQQRVTKNLFLTFSVNVTTTQDDLVQLQYQLSRKWSVEATRNQDGGYSLEIRSRKTF